MNLTVISFYCYPKCCCENIFRAFLGLTVVKLIMSTCLCKGRKKTSPVAVAVAARRHASFVPCLSAIAAASSALVPPTGTDERKHARVRTHDASTCSVDRSTVQALSSIARGVCGARKRPTPTAQRAGCAIDRKAWRG